MSGEGINVSILPRAETHDPREYKPVRRVDQKKIITLPPLLANRNTALHFLFVGEYIYNKIHLKCKNLILWEELNKKKSKNLNL